MKTFFNKGASLTRFLFTFLTPNNDYDAKLINELQATLNNGNIGIKSGKVTTEITGESVWETMTEDGFIFMTDQRNSNRGLIITFNTANPPTRTTTYKVVKNGFGETPNHIDIVFSEYRTINAKTCILQWISTDESGELTLFVSGDKITANLDGIVLQPILGSIGFKSLNVGEYAKLGILYGSLAMDM